MFTLRDENGNIYLTENTVPLYHINAIVSETEKTRSKIIINSTLFPYIALKEGGARIISLERMENGIYISAIVEIYAVPCTYLIIGSAGQGSKSMGLRIRNTEDWIILDSGYALSKMSDTASFWSVSSMRKTGGSYSDGIELGNSATTLDLYKFDTTVDPDAIDHAQPQGTVHFDPNLPPPFVTVETGLVIPENTAVILMTWASTFFTRNNGIGYDSTPFPVVMNNKLLSVPFFYLKKSASGSNVFGGVVAMIYTLLDLSYLDEIKTALT